ncbi:hypothetical protein BVH01_15945 [Pseudomonas sp. PA1(2017)]|uniref:hypothetical protein n=1 Tax=Pseudomonas sp. PA1(2017) TaxID=1932113 RepID=UPI00095CA53D|nr:hypothetical protein [Pseudomonas sp. PA1(2017)]OLU15310.1 hypothetical protein BVH01_15945 [Pseudomonas sp. PA1(2017)]
MNIFKNDSFLLASIPIISFIGAYIFELGYANEFGYPHELIELDLKLIIISLFCSFILLVPAYAYYYTFLALFIRAEKEFRFIGASLTFSLPGVAMVYIAGMTNTFMNYFVVVCLLMGAIPLILALVKHRTLDWRKAFNAEATREGYAEVTSRFDDNAIPRARDKFYAFIFLCFAGAIFLFMIRGAGTITANMKTDYHTFYLDEKEVAIIAAYGDHLILGGVSEDMFDKSIFVISKSSDSIKDLKSARFENFLSRL